MENQVEVHRVTQAVLKACARPFVATVLSRGRGSHLAEELVRELIVFKESDTNPK